MVLITQASLADVSELNRLVNSAYRGESSKKGWTHEADLLDGIRITEDELTRLINSADTYILKYVVEQTICGCVLLESSGSQLHLAMLTVDPLRQNTGIGKALLAAAEVRAAEVGYKKIEITVISVRSELIAWYTRRGYADTGTRKPFPGESSGVGTPKIPLEFIVMEKML